MDPPRRRSYLPVLLKILAVEVLDIELIATTVYAIYAVLSFAIFYVLWMNPTPVSWLLSWSNKIMTDFFGVGSFWATLWIVFLIFFIPLVHYLIGVHGPGLLRKLLHRIFVQPKLDRIYRQNHDEVDETHISKPLSVWSRFGVIYRSTIHSLGRFFTSSGIRRGYIAIPSDADEASDALSLHGIDSSETRLVESTVHDRDEDTTDQHSDRNRQAVERAGHTGARLGNWIGSKLGDVLTLPLAAAVHLGELSTTMGLKARAMRLRRERRQDLPGDIQLP